MEIKPVAGELKFLSQVVMGEQVLNPLRNIVLSITGKTRNEPRREIQVTAKCEDGQDLDPFFMPENTAVVVHEPGVQNVLALYKGKEARYKPQKVTKIVIDDQGNVIPQKPRKSLGSTSAVTGFKEGTDAHAFGLLLLQGPTDAEAIENIFKVLEPRGKTKGYAKAWVSYCRSKKPHIYKGR